jgi:hypothetical protein
MAEKELRKEIDEITGELGEIKGELDIRIAKLKKLAKPLGLAIAGVIGLKIGLKIMKGVLGLLWKLKSVFLAAALLFVLQLYVKSKKEK